MNPNKHFISSEKACDKFDLIHNEKNGCDVDTYDADEYVACSLCRTHRGKGKQPILGSWITWEKSEEQLKLEGIIQ